MKPIRLLIFSVFSISLYAQNPSENYIKKIQYKEPSTQGITSNDTIVNVSYFDGLGRVKQTVAVGAGGQGQDIVTPVLYDEFGRQKKQYLSTPSTIDNTSSPNYRDNNNLVSELNTYYYNKHSEDFDLQNPNPYSETFYEPSPLGRVLKQGAPGEAWKGNDTDDNDHTIKYGYNANTEYEVRRFRVNFETTGGVEDTEKTLLKYDDYYQANQLHKTIIKDENWNFGSGNNNTTEEFKDKQGRIILKRTYNEDEAHDTQYVYDRYGNLTYVIPPLASDGIVTSISSPVYSGRNYSWVELAKVDIELADAYDKVLMDYDNNEILNLDLIDEYGGQGGFSLIPQEDGTLTMNINIATNQSMPYTVGAIVDLGKEGLGTFQDTELGRISGTNYEYIFLIKNNQVTVEGSGKVPSLNTTFNSAQSLSYSKVYPWTAFCVTDSQTAIDYQTAIDSLKLDDNQILNTYIDNSYGAMGGIAIEIDEDDTVTLSINLSASIKSLEFNTGNVIPLPVQRSLPNMDFGTLNGAGYNYNLSIKNNNLHIVGAGQFNNFNYQNSMFTEVTYKIISSKLYGLCYIYHYDSRNRMIEKHIPGAGWTHIVYDKLDRPILTQDENQRLKGQWLFTKYDKFNRITYTGEYYDNRDRKTIQEVVNGVTNPVWSESRTSGTFTSGGSVVYNINYTNNAFPQANQIANPDQPTGQEMDINLFTINYYDDYNFDLAGITLPSTVNSVDVTNNLKGLTTGIKVKVLTGNSTTIDWITTVTGYDDKSRPIFSHTKNTYMGTEDIIESRLNFTGQTTFTSTHHLKTGKPELIIYDSYTYDRMGRLVKHRQSQTPQGGWQIGPYTHVIAENHYDELGQLDEKGIGGKDGVYDDIRLQTVDYTYNIRGWLKNINNPDTPLHDDLFAFKINYTQTDESDGTALYNGNISETYWKSITDNNKRGYYYEYDALNRLVDANYIGNYGLVDNPTEEEKYTEGNISYDKNGNILHLERYGWTNLEIIEKIDVLTYLYYPDSNQLKSVSDTGGSEGFRNWNTGTDDDYRYDVNGNMVEDKNKGLIKYGADAIHYNHLNLPTSINFGNNSSIVYVYDATGVKLQKIVTQAPAEGSGVTTTDYANGFIYENDVLQFFSHPEGYVTAPVPVNNEYNPDDFQYIYQYKDHLGNTRLSYSDIDDDGYINDGNYAFWDGFENQSGWDGEHTSLDKYYSSPGGKIRSGNYSGQINCPESLGQAKVVHSSEWVPVSNTQDTEYTYSAWVYSNGPSAGIKLFMKDGSGYITQSLGVSTSEDVKWVHLTGTVNVSSSITSLNIQLINYGQQSEIDDSYSVWFDDVSIQKTNTTSEIVQEDNYYPFGLKHKGYNITVNGGNDVAQKYKYNGKELQDEFRLNLYDYGARNYDPAIGRFMNIDPHANSYYRYSPYVYAFNSPSLVIDPDGKDGIVTGSGTEDDPYVITANYYYYGLNEEQAGAFEDAIGAYNNGGKARRIRVGKGKKIYVQFNLKAVKAKDAKEANEMADKDVKKSETRGEDGTIYETRVGYGNTVSLGPAREANELGYASNRHIDLDDKGIGNFHAVPNPSNRISYIYKGAAIHEIGHNLGAVHFDPGDIMDSATRDFGGNKNPRTIFNMAGVDKSGIKAMLGRAVKYSKVVNDSSAGYHVVKSTYLNENQNKKVSSEGSVGRLVFYKE